LEGFFFLERLLCSALSFSSAQEVSGYQESVHREG
jgi:hypothetical protein